MQLKPLDLNILIIYYVGLKVQAVLPKQVILFSTTNVSYAKHEIKMIRISRFIWFNLV